MSKEIPSWNPEDYQTPTGDVIDRLADPAGGIALVDFDFDTKGLMDAIDDALILDKDVDRRHFMRQHQQARRGNERVVKKHHNAGDGTEPLIPRVPELGERIVELGDAVHSLRGEIGMPVDEHEWSKIDVWSVSRATLTERHFDYGRATIWLGATQPELRILDRDKWKAVPELPDNKALIWRNGYTGRPKPYNPIRSLSYLFFRYNHG